MQSDIEKRFDATAGARSRCYECNLRMENMISFGEATCLWSSQSVRILRGNTVVLRILEILHFPGSLVRLGTSARPEACFAQGLLGYSAKPQTSRALCRCILNTTGASFDPGSPNWYTEWQVTQAPEGLIFLALLRLECLMNDCHIHDDCIDLKKSAAPALQANALHCHNPSPHDTSAVTSAFVLAQTSIRAPRNWLLYYQKKYV